MPRFGETHKLLSPTHPATEVLPGNGEPADGSVITWSAARKAWYAEAPAAPPAGGFTGGLLELTGVWLQG